MDYVIALRTPGEPFEIVHDTHTLGVFPSATWRQLLDEAGLAVVDAKVANPFAHEQEVRRTETVVRLTASGRISTLGDEHTFVPDTWRARC